MRECLASPCPIYTRRGVTAWSARSVLPCVFDSLDGVVRVCGHADGVWLYVDDEHGRFGNIPLDQIFDPGALSFDPRDTIRSYGLGLAVALNKA